MGTNLANKASDGRRSKNRNLNRRQIPTIEELIADYESRPAAKYRLDQTVNTPTGTRPIVDMYHSRSRGWIYRFWDNGYLSYTESELSPRGISQGELLLLKNISSHYGANA